jgi:flavin reductase (DIM6/NTAB) family NADH-FMN oxidoreductase RutF
MLWSYTCYILSNTSQPVVVAVARTELGFHGATLTSFASLTLEPHPLVAFSLRLPSRMADLLRPRFEFGIRGARCAPIPLTVSLLAGTNQPIADALAKPGIDQAPIFAAPGWDASDPPALTDAVGALCCEVVHSVPLRDVGGDTASESAGSELFICKVVDATRGPAKDSLVHYQRDYYSVSSHEHDQ